MADEAPCTVRDLLPQKIVNMGEVLKKALADDSVTERASPPGFIWDFLGNKALTSVRDGLDCDVFSLLARGWCQAKELRASAKDSRKAGEPVTLFLGGHKLATQVHPVLQIIFGTLQCRPIRFTVEIAADFRTAELTIKNGYITAIGAGDCSVGAQLSYADTVLHEIKSRNVKVFNPLLLPAPGLEIG